MQTKIMQELESVLLQFGDKYYIEDTINKAKVIEDIENYAEDLILSLLDNETVNKHYSKEIDSYTVILTDKLIETFEMDDYWMDSHTKYSKKIGLTANGHFVDESTDVILDFPYKDTVLKGGMSKEDVEQEDMWPNEPFYNEVIAAEEIDIMLDKKVLVNSKRYDINGESKIDTFTDKDNLIIKGNNLLALHTLKDRFLGKVKLIYIDPPYNTGNDGFKYNDNFNHSSWLIFLKNRIEIAWELLKDDGVLFVSLDDTEAHYAKVLIDEIFGRENFIADIAHKSRASVSNDKIISSNHNHILFYGKNERKIFNNKHEYGVENKLEGFNKSDERGEYKLVPVDGPGGASKGNPFYEFLGVEGYWRFSKSKMKKMYDDGLIVKTDNNLQQKYYKKDAAKKRRTLTTWWDDDFLTSSATRELNKLFGEKVFNNPKNERLIKQIIEFASKENDIVLDFFMGSATTQAVAMKMNRRFIGIEQMDYIETVSVPRLQKVIDGEQGGVSEEVGWKGGGSFVYAELMEKSRGYIDAVQKSTNEVELFELYKIMLDNVSLDFRTDLEGVQETLESKATLKDKKNVLLKVIDKNQLYYNLSEIDDQTVRDLICDSDYKFNQSFYLEEEDE